MIQENSQKIIIASLAVFLLASFIFLAYTERRQHQLNGGWFLYFENPKDSSLDFTIENYGDKSNFNWEISADDIIISKGNKKVLKGEKKLIIFTLPPLPLGEGWGESASENKKVIIKVSDGKNKKEIYKIIF